VTRVAVVGSGSAGRRHLAALRARLPDAEIVVVRRPRSGRTADGLLALGAHVVEDLDDALAVPPDLAVVAGPAPHHREAAERALAVGAQLLVEKPLAATVADGVAVARAARRAGRTPVLGYHLRWSDTPAALIRMVRDGTIGEPTAFELRVGQHLSQWRPDVDPRHSVSARAELGGGVLLELSHEIDAALQIAPRVTEVAARLGHDGAPTDGVVDTVADLELTGPGGIHGTVHLDMVAPVPFRTWHVTGTAGTVTADLLGGRVTLERSGHSPTVIDAPPGERDRAEQRLIDDVVTSSGDPTEPRCGVGQGIAVLEVVEAARRSHTEGRPAAVHPAGSGAAVP
jgi:predicted dehydrogenase